MSTPAVPLALAIVNVEGSTPAEFAVTRLDDGKSVAPVPISSPYDFPVLGQPNSNLMHELRWYLERFLDYPFPPETDRAERVLESLKAWGRQAFNSVFDQPDAAEWFATSTIVQVCSDDPHVLSWPWEALFDPQADYVAHGRRIERRTDKACDPQSLAGLPSDRVNILLVVARPLEHDVAYRSVARSLVELIQSQRLPVHLDVLRPPTFDQLRDHLCAKPGYYHVLHFDGHGAYGCSQFAPHQPQSPTGCLIFENAWGEPDAKSAGEISALLREHAVRGVVVNACQSATLDVRAEDAFASVATALMQIGMHSVVAMAYCLYVSAAQVFLPAFYRRLFEAGSVAEAVRMGRHDMLAHKDRVCARGRYPLEDWLVPVLYQQNPLDFQFAAKAKLEARESHIPKEVQEHRDEYRLVGRDGPILEMERALHRKTPAILVQGLGGVGKTTLAREFLRWLDDTGGLEGTPLWFDFRDIRTAEYVINQTGQALYGANFGVAKNKLELLARALKELRLLMVWDNFESAAGNLMGEDRAELGWFLDAIRGGRGKVIITSRSREEWLTSARRYELRLGGLDGEERWEYCEAILRVLKLKVNWNDPELSKLVGQLAGHPLAMRAVLPKLEQMSPAMIGDALRTSIAELGLNEEEEQGRLFATLRFVEQGLAKELQPLLGLVGLHEGYLDADNLEAMAQQTDSEWTRGRIDRLMAALGAAGLVSDIGAATFQMHPLLTSYLRYRGEAPERCQKAFVAVMASLADDLAPDTLHAQRLPFLLHGANFHFAVSLADRLSLDQSFVALNQALGAHALRGRNFAEASRLFELLARHFVARDASEGEAAAYHQLGIIAQERREYGAAREWYFKSLAVKQKSGNLRGKAITYLQLGRAAAENRDFAEARKWSLDALAINESEGNLQGAGVACHQLGMVAQMQRDFGGAQKWYLKSLAIKEKAGDFDSAARTYHQLGMMAEERQEFRTAEDWYLKSLAIKGRHDNDGAASTCHQLGIVAVRLGAFEKAREWYLKSLAVSEQCGNLQHSAMTYGQLGILAALQGSFEHAGKWLVKSVAVFLEIQDEHEAERNVGNFIEIHRRASPAGKLQLEAIWHDSNLGQFPTEPNP